MTEGTASQSILVVDDEPDSLETLRLLLMEEGFDARGASTAAEALSAIAERRPDLLIVDIMMPGMTGFDLCEHLRARQETRDMPIIAYSGYPMQAFSNPGPYDRVFLKPADFGELVGAIRELVDARAVSSRAPP